MRVTILSLTAAAVLAAPVAAETYPTPQDALEAMISALEAADGAALLEVFPGAEELLSTGNPERDAENMAEILGLYQGGYRFLPEGDGVALLLGETGWPFPIPLARGEDGWFFDVEAGREEVLFRRIGLNELETIDTLSVYVDIQAEFRLVDHNGDGVMEFAAGLLPSEDGARDGLYWGDDTSPMGRRIALASLDGYSDGDGDREAEPFGGYYYRVLTEQGPSAPGGAYSYMQGGHMVGGHAMLAVPADYGDSGVHSFLVGENGVILEADLGEDTLDIAQDITAYDPDERWTPVDN